jgi:hypothetical protein
MLLVMSRFFKLDQFRYQFKNVISWSLLLLNGCAVKIYYAHLLNTGEWLRHIYQSPRTSIHQTLYLSISCECCCRSCSIVFDCYFKIKWNLSWQSIRSSRLLTIFYRLFTSRYVGDLKTIIKGSCQGSTWIHYNHSMSIGFDPIRMCWSCPLDFVEESLIGQFIIHLLLTPYADL